MKTNVNDYDIKSIIEMAWCDKTSFDLLFKLIEKRSYKNNEVKFKKTSFQV